MLIFVIGCNCCLALLCLFMAHHFWRWRRRLIRLTHLLKQQQRQTQFVLAQAPAQILGSQDRVTHLHQQCQMLGWQLTQCQQALDLLHWGVQLWQWQWRRRSVRGRFVRRPRRV